MSNLPSLYALTQEYEEYLDHLYDPEYDEDSLFGVIELTEQDIKDKAKNYASILQVMDNDIEFLKLEEKRLAEKRKVLENRTKRLKERLQECMKTTGLTKFTSGTFDFRIQKNPPSVAMDTTDMTVIPMRFLSYPDPVIDKKAILTELKAGADLTGIAHMNQSESLRIK